MKYSVLLRPLAKENRHTKKLKVNTWTEKTRNVRISVVKWPKPLELVNDAQTLRTDVHYLAVNIKTVKPFC